MRARCNFIQPATGLFIQGFDGLGQIGAFLLNLQSQGIASPAERFLQHVLRSVLSCMTTWMAGRPSKLITALEEEV